VSLGQSSPSHEVSDVGRAAVDQEAQPSEGMGPSLAEEAVPIRDSARLSLDREREDRVQAIVRSKPARRLPVSRFKGFAMASTIAFLLLGSAVLALSRGGESESGSPRSTAIQPGHGFATRSRPSPRVAASRAGVSHQGGATSPAHRRAAAVRAKRERQRATRARMRRSSRESHEAAKEPARAAPSPPPSVEESPPVVEVEAPPSVPSPSTPAPTAESQAQEQFGFER
jgi:hypothetical protein